MNENIIALMIPILALSIPVVAILVSHQQKMAQIIHDSSRSRQSDGEITALREEIRELKQALTEQALALEAVRDLKSAELQDRMRSNA